MIKFTSLPPTAVGPPIKEQARRATNAKELITREAHSTDTWDSRILYHQNLFNQRCHKVFDTPPECLLLRLTSLEYAQLVLQAPFVVISAFYDNVSRD